MSEDFTNSAVSHLERSGFLERDDRILIYNTGSGYKYLEAWTAHYGASLPTSGELFGITGTNLVPPT